MPDAFDPYSVSLTPGVTLVEASAGTGKTTALTALVARLVVDPTAGAIDDDAGWPDLRRALVVTFTNAATAELVTRVRQTLRQASAYFQETADRAEAPRAVGELLDRWGQTPEARALSRQRLTAALASGEASVFTIDGFLKRVLERSAFESGEPFAFSVADSDADLRKRALTETWQARVRQFPALAAVAIAGGTPWSLGRLDAALVEVTRHAGTRIVPAPEPLADAVARYQAAVSTLANVWDERRAVALLDDAPLTKAAPPDPAGLFGRVSAFVARGGTAHVDAVLAASSEGIAAGVHKSRGKAAIAEIRADAAFAACDDIGAAIEAMRLALLADVIPAVDAARKRLAARAGTLTFDDLLGRVHNALHHPRIGPVLGRAIRGQYRLALVDEFQDTNARQDAVFRCAFAGAPLVLVGDPKQAVYAFRGADVFTYIGARRHAAQTFTLGRNFRSAPALVGAVNALFARGAGSGARPFVHGDIPFAPAEAAIAAPRIRGIAAQDGSSAPLVWWSAAGLPQGRDSITKAVATPACVAAVVAEARRLVDDPAVEVCETVDGVDRWRRLRAADLAVLVATNRQAALMQDALRRAGLPSVVGKGGDVRHSPEMADLEHVLRAVDAPGNRAAVRTALATELWGWGAAKIAALDEPAWAGVTDGLRAVRAVWQRRGVFEAATTFLEREGVLTRLLGRPDGERRATNLRHALELAHDAEGAGAQSADRLLRWLRTRDTQSASGETVEMRLESDDHAVQIATMHGCKGLQYRVVFAPFLWEGREKQTWHGSNSELSPPQAHVSAADGGTEIVYDVGSPELDHHRALADAERLAEHLRLTYVALTRAEDRAYVVWGPLSGAHASGIGHLLHGHRAVHAGCDGQFAHASREAAKAALPGTVAALRTWIDAEGLSDRMAVELLPDAAPSFVSPPEAPETASPVGDARRLSRASAERIATPTRRASFSGWTSGAPRDDRDDDAAPARPDDGAAPLGMAAFASGAAAGTALHAVMQTAAFHDPDAYLDPASAASRNVARTLRLHGLADGRARTGGRTVHRGPIADVPATVQNMLYRLFRTPIPTIGARLQDVPADPQRRDTEWRFVVPLNTVAPAIIAEAFDAHGDDRLRALAPRIRRLTAREADGLLVGTADLVAEIPTPAGTRYAVFDWKSNWLGPAPAYYGPEAMDAAMAANHYRLQSHLYVLGLHRHLRARLGAAYDYDRDVAGMAYVFLRGVPEGEPAEAPATGFDVEKPSLALIEALDAVLLAPADLR